MPESERTLRVDGLCAGYRRGMPIVRDLDLEVAEGEVVTIIGPNGAGKSTLAKAVAGLVLVESGNISYAGQRLNGVSPHHLARHGIAYVPQTANVFRTLSVRNNLSLAARRGGGRAKARAQALASMLSVFGVLGEKQGSLAGSLSGGQRQMLAVAMALVVSPTLVLMDEPTAGLAPRAASEVLALIRKIASEGVSVLLVEQNARAALQSSDRAYVLSDGRNQLDGPAMKLLDDPAVAQVYLGGRPART